MEVIVQYIFLSIIIILATATSYNLGRIQGFKKGSEQGIQWTVMKFKKLIDKCSTNTKQEIENMINEEASKTA